MLLRHDSVADGTKSLRDIKCASTGEVVKTKDAFSKNING